MRLAALLRLALSLGGLALAAAARAQAPAPGDLVVNEIMYDPPASQGSSSNEWVEVYNRSAQTFDLSDAAFQFGDSGTLVRITTTPTPIGPGAYAVLVRVSGEFQAAYPGVPFITVTGFPALNNTGDTVRLVYGSTEIDAVPYLPAWGGADRSLERRDPDGPSASASNWGSTTDPALGTPGRQNSLVVVDTTPPELIEATALSETEVEVVFSEPVVPEPGDYSISDGIGTPVAAASAPGDPSRVRLTLGVPLTGPHTYTLTVSNVADLAGNVLATGSTTFFFGTLPTPAPRDVVINEIMYDPPASQGTSANEWVELYNRSTQTFDLAQFAVGDASTATPAALPSRPFPPGTYVVLANDPVQFAAAYPGVDFVALPALPTLNNDADRPRLLADSTEIDAVPYTTSWGGVDASLERRDPAGPSAFAGNWGTTTDPDRGTPGEQNSLFAPDTDGPTIVDVEVSANADTLTAAFDQPLDPATVTPGAFTLTGPTAASVVEATYDESGGDPRVRLVLSPPLDPGTYTLAAPGVRNTQGQAGTGPPFTFTASPDRTPPALLSAAALSETEVEVVFSEPVVPEPGDYGISDGIGTPVAAASVPGDPSRVRLTLGAPLTGPRTYTLTATNVADLLGNVLASATTTFFFGTPDVPAPREIVVNEIMYDPPAPQPSSNEWVELYNRTPDRTFDLSTLRLVVGDDTLAITGTPTTVGPGGYAVLVDNATAFAAAFPGVPFVAVPGFPALLNSGDLVAVLAGTAVIDRVPYQPSWGGVDASLERRDPAGPSAFAGNWGTSTAPARGTPGAQNSIFAPDTNGPTVVDVDVSPRGDTLTVTFDQPLDPATVAPGAFTLTGPSAPAVVGATYDASGGDPVVVLALAARLEPGTYTLAAPGVRNTLGEPGTGPALTFTADPDRTPPALEGALALDATTIEVTFSEPVTASGADTSRYTISTGDTAFTVTAVTFPVEGDRTRARLTPQFPLEERTLYTLTVGGVEDLAGNVLESASTAVFFGEADAPQAGDLVVNEVMFDPEGGSAGEYVELYNRSERTLDLARIGLTDGPAAEADPISETPFIVAPGAFVVVVADRAAFATRFPGVPAVEADDFPSLNNDGDAVVVAYQGLVVDSVRYDPDWHRAELEDATGIALERRDPAGPSSSRLNWSSSLDPSGGTPGRANSVTTVPGEPPGEAGLAVSRSPFDPDGGEATSIAYTLETDAALVRVRIFDAAGRLVRRIEDGRLSGRTGAIPWDGRGDDGRALRIGIYVVLLEAVDVEGGTAEAHRAAVVLGRRF